jgi:hypothetical protein
VDVEKVMTIIITVICSVFASSGFWAYMMKKSDVKDVTREMLLGLGHDRLIYLGFCYIDRGWINREEFENINTYLYGPYKRMKGNGTVDRIMGEVNKLPIRNTSVVDMAKEKRNDVVCMPSQK